MAESLSLDLLGVTHQNTKKIVIQDWLDGNNFSQASSCFEPLVVYADVHHSASGVGKPSQSDIDEDFVSVSQILSRKKLTKPVKKKLNMNISNFDAIEPYIESKIYGKSTEDVNDAFDEIFHNGEKMKSIIKKTYPGKVKSKTQMINKSGLLIQKNLFTNNSSEQNESSRNNVSKNCTEKGESENKVISSGSGELWSPTQHNVNTRSAKKLTNNRLWSNRICKKYFRNIIKQKDKLTESNAFQAINSVRKSKDKTLKIVKRNINVTLKNSCSKNKIIQTEKGCTTNNEIDIVKSINTVPDNVTRSSNQACKRNNVYNNSYCNYKLSGMPFEEFRKIIENKPIVMVERLDYRCTKIEKQELNLSKKSSKTNVPIVTCLDNVTHSNLRIQSTCTKTYLNRDSIIPNNKNETVKAAENIIKSQEVNFKKQESGTDKTFLERLNQMKTHCESNISVKGNDKIKKNSGRINKILKRKVKLKKDCQSTTNNMDCNSTASKNNKTTAINVNIKKFAGDKVKTVPKVLLERLNVCDNETQIITNIMIPQVKLDKSSNVNNSYNNKTLLVKQVECNVESMEKDCKSKEVKMELVTPIKVCEKKSPGWSRLEKIKRVFKTSEKTQLNVSIGSKASKSSKKMNTSNLTSDSGCENTEHQHDTLLKCKSIVKDEGEKTPIVNIHKIDDEKVSRANNKVTEFDNKLNHSIFKNTGNKSEEEKLLHLKRKWTEIMPELCRDEQSQKLKSNVKRRKITTVIENARDPTSIHTNTTENTNLSAPKIKNNFQKSVSTSTWTSSKDIGTQTNPEIYFTCLLQLLKSSHQKEANTLSKECVSPIIFGDESNQSPCISDKLTQTVDHCHVLNEQFKDSNYVIGSPKTIKNSQDRNKSLHSDFTHKTNVDLTKRITNNAINNNKFNLSHDTEIIEKEHNVFSKDIFLNDSNNTLSENVSNNPERCLHSLCKLNIFRDQIPFKNLNSIGSISLDFSHTKFSESILNSKKVHSDVVRDVGFLQYTNKNNKCESPKSDINNKICDSLDLIRMNEVKSRSLVLGVKTQEDNNIETSSNNSDFIQNSPDIHNSKYNKVENMDKSICKLGSSSDNESMMSLSTLALDNVNYTSFGTENDYEIVVSNLDSESCNDKNIASFKNVDKTNMGVGSFRNSVSESIQHIREVLNEIWQSNKNSGWSQNHPTNVAETGFSELANTMDTSMLTEILDTQQQKHLRDECLQLAAQIKTIQKELNDKKEQRKQET